MPHTHFHIIPRAGPAGKEDRVGEMGDAERKNIALGEGPREKLSAEDGAEVSRLVKEEVRVEIGKLRAQGFLTGDDGGNELWFKVSERGLKL